MNEFALFRCKHCDKIFAVPSVMIEDEEIGGDGWQIFNCLYCKKEVDTQHNFLQHFKTDIKVNKKIIYEIKTQ